MKAEAEELLKIEHIKKSYEGNEILKDLSLTIHKGEFVVIIGPVSYKHLPSPRDKSNSRLT